MIAAAGESSSSSRWPCTSCSSGPRRRMMKQQQAVQRSVEVGDEVLLTSGMYGFITGFEEGSDVVWVEVDDDVQIRVTRAGISGKVATSARGRCAGVRIRGASSRSEATSRPTLKGGSKADTRRTTPRPQNPSTNDPPPPLDLADRDRHRRRLLLGHQPARAERAGARPRPPGRDLGRARARRGGVGGRPRRSSAT